MFDTVQSVEATLTGIRFSGDNNFIIGMFTNDKGDFGGLGSMFRPEIGMDYKLFGEWSTHAQYGPQVKFVRYEAIQPCDTAGIYKYVVRIAKWVGPSIGDQLVETYGEETLTILRTDPDRIAKEIKGLTLTRATEIQTELVELEDTEAIIVELMNVLTTPGLRKSLPFDLVDRFGSDAVDMVRENPYLLTDFPGVGFLLADQVALSMHFDQSSLYRKMAGAEHALKMNEREGNTWHEMELLIRKANELLGIETASEAIAQLLEDDRIVRSADGWVALSVTHVDEDYIAAKVCRLLA